jgi:hypothetical protein
MRVASAAGLSMIGAIARSVRRLAMTCRMRLSVMLAVLLLVGCVVLSLQFSLGGSHMTDGYRGGQTLEAKGFSALRVSLASRD